MLTVLLILSFGITLTGFFVHKLYREQRFVSDTEQVLSHLTMAQDLMLILDADVKVIFDKDRQDKTSFMQIDVEKPFTHFQEKVIERKIPLTTIGSIQLNDKSGNPLVLRFSLGGMSQGVLKLVEGDDNEGRVEFIALPGYPAPFRGLMADQQSYGEQKRRIERDLIDEKEAEVLSERLFPSEVYEKLQKEKNKNSKTPLSTP